MTNVTEFLRSVIILDTGPVIPALENRPTTHAGRVAALVFAAAGLVLALIGSFLPWVVSGQVRRSSYAVTGMIDRLGIAGDGVLGSLVAGWPLHRTVVRDAGGGRPAPPVGGRRRVVCAARRRHGRGVAGVAGRQWWRRDRRSGRPDRAIGDVCRRNVAHRRRSLADHRRLAEFGPETTTKRLRHASQWDTAIRSIQVGRGCSWPGLDGGADRCAGDVPWTGTRKDGTTRERPRRAHRGVSGRGESGRGK